jgi:hypothetical protein
MNPESRTILPKMAFTGFASRYREPTLDEGFDDITKVNFKVRFGHSLGFNPIQHPLFLPPPPPAVTCLQHVITLTLDTGSSMGPKHKRPNGASIGCLEPTDLWTWLQYFTATALSCIFDRPAGEPHVPACLVAIWKAIALARCAKLYRHMPQHV